MLPPPAQAESISKETTSAEDGQESLGASSVHECAAFIHVDGADEGTECENVDECTIHDRKSTGS